MMNLSAMLSRHYFVEGMTPSRFYQEYHEKWQTDKQCDNFKCRVCYECFESYSKLRKHLKIGGCKSAKVENLNNAAAAVFTLDWLRKHGQDENANYLTLFNFCKSLSVHGKNESDEFNSADGNDGANDWMLIDDDTIRQNPQLKILKPQVLLTRLPTPPASLSAALNKKKVEKLRDDVDARDKETSQMHNLREHSLLAEDRTSNCSSRNTLCNLIENDTWPTSENKEGEPEKRHLVPKTETLNVSHERERRELEEENNAAAAMILSMLDSKKEVISVVNTSTQNFGAFRNNGGGSSLKSILPSEKYVSCRQKSNGKRVSFVSGETVINVFDQVLRVNCEQDVFDKNQLGTCNQLSSYSSDFDYANQNGHHSTSVNNLDSGITPLVAHPTTTTITALSIDKDSLITSSQINSTPIDYRSNIHKTIASQSSTAKETEKESDTHFAESIPIGEDCSSLTHIEQVAHSTELNDNAGDESTLSIQRTESSNDCQITSDLPSLLPSTMPTNRFDLPSYDSNLNYFYDSDNESNLTDCASSIFDESDSESDFSPPSPKIVKVSENSSSKNSNNSPPPTSYFNGHSDYDGGKLNAKSSWECLMPPKQLSSLTDVFLATHFKNRKTKFASYKDQQYAKKSNWTGSSITEYSFNYRLAADRTSNGVHFSPVQGSVSDHKTLFCCFDCGNSFFNHLAYQVHRHQVH